jgi:hypothetical protein
VTVCVNWWKKLEKIVEDGDTVIFQHPMYGNRVTKKMVVKIKSKVNCRFVAVVHDLESLRGGIAGLINKNTKTNQIADTDMLKTFDAVICHNEHMRQYMIKQGFEAKRLVNLEIFDYLSDVDRHQPAKGKKPSIAIAGNLAIGKCGYIYDICKEGHNQNLTVNLFGNNYESEKAVGNMIWHGSFKPEELPGHLVGDFGLIWDGISAETCAGNTGEYLKYNNPHKTSLYLSSGMPVIVWSKAAIADFVLENKVGITVDSLFTLEETIANISAEDYKAMCENTYMVSKKLHDGFYFKKALGAALKL